MEVLKGKFLFIFIFICLTGSAFGQIASSDRQSISDTTTIYPQILQYQFINKTQSHSTRTLIKSPYENWGFVCKWENNNDQQLQMPVRFRLGTLDYVNKLEGKN